MDVVDVAQPEEAGEEAAGQHAHGQVEADGQALADDAAAGTRDDITLAGEAPGAEGRVFRGRYLRYIPTA